MYIVYVRFVLHVYFSTMQGACNIQTQSMHSVYHFLFLEVDVQLLSFLMSALDWPLYPSKEPKPH